MGGHDRVLGSCWRGDGEEWRAKRRKRTVKTAGANGEFRGCGAEWCNVDGVRLVRARFFM